MEKTNPPTYFLGSQSGFRLVFVFLKSHGKFAGTAEQTAWQVKVGLCGVYGLIDLSQTVGIYQIITI